MTEPAIKSYLYTPPPKSETQIPAAPASPPKQVEEQEQVKEVSPPPTENKTNTQPADSQKTPPSISDKKQQNKVPALKASGDIKKSGESNKVPRKFSARGQLEQLKNSINERMIAEEIYRHQRHKSPSIMHGAQEPVPHSKKTIDAIQKKADSTTQYSQGMSITKNDDGTCSVTEDLSNVGMEGLSATQSFSCGESKEEKYFREHMKNVLKKLGK
ncbi:hypothetical protein SG34_003785 [Thalassomonas viridans]|uniref:Uncharacterized protein n=1 Tax=Thalassomonas viridans TaxID=137584 RepID=A0AAF0CAT6_9GAMM|nr:hypothetical protein [Thalassomonas viridans]WDE06059.1 hypothetical protein SG34_003785 [Thalassomonas viridans]